MSQYESGRNGKKGSIPGDALLSMFILRPAKHMALGRSIVKKNPI